jgi:hypothetical protein
VGGLWHESRQAGKQARHARTHARTGHVVHGLDGLRIVQLVDLHAALGHARGALLGVHPFDQPPHAGLDRPAVEPFGDVVPHRRRRRCAPALGHASGAAAVPLLLLVMAPAGGLAGWLAGGAGRGVRACCGRSVVGETLAAAAAVERRRGLSCCACVRARVSFDRSVGCPAAAAAAAAAAAGRRTVSTPGCKVSQQGRSREAGSTRRCSAVLAELAYFFKTHVGRAANSFGRQRALARGTSSRSQLIDRSIESN